MLYFLMLYAMLADPVFEVREAASDRICHMVDRRPDLFGPRLAELAATATEPEIVARSRRPLAAYGRWNANSYTPRTVPVWPSVDMQPLLPARLPFFGHIRDRCAGNDAVNTFMWQYTFKSRPYTFGPYWHNHRSACERMARSMLMNGIAREKVDELLGVMWEIENAHNSDCGELWAESRLWMEWRGGYPTPSDPK